MYLRTRPRTSRRRGFSFIRLLRLILIPVLIVIAVGVWEYQDAIRPIVSEWLMPVVQQAADTVSTIAAPTPVPTQDPSDNRRLAEAAWQNGQFQESVRLYEQILPALPNDVKSHYYYTLGLIMQGRYDDAVGAAERAVTASPFSSDAWAIRAMALNRAEDFRPSIVSALRAIELNPQSARAHAFLAESYADLGQTTRARQEIDRALELNPDSYEAHYVNGIILWENEYDFPGARIELEDAYELSNGAAHIGLRLAQLRRTIEDDPTPSVAVLTDILDRNPDSALILYELGNYSRRTGEFEQGETFLRRCISAVPDHVNCNYELGRVLYSQTKTEEARRAFERAIDLGSGNPYHYYWAGRAQVEGLGDCGLAMRYFQPGYQIVQTEQATGSTFYVNTIEDLDSLLEDYEEAMSPCLGGVPLPTADPDAAPDLDATATPAPDA